ncbi:MAG: hypothetical protein B7Z73_06425 [Planctomycetia bacterium 21-64-5]|nr:MAG: hypothetical protein B7Z73_06425 [Planctomycetia bacterium 21-64-5]
MLPRPPGRQPSPARVGAVGRLYLNHKWRVPIDDVAGGLVSQEDADAQGDEGDKALSAGPQVTLTLPMFNRNQGGIAAATATRAQLAAQFRASLASADAGAQALISRITALQAESETADRAAAAATQIAAQTSTALRQGALDAQTGVNLQTAAGDRQREAITLRDQLLTARLSLNTMLGIGLPAIIAAPLEPPL